MEEWSPERILDEDKNECSSTKYNEIIAAFAALPIVYCHVSELAVSYLDYQNLSCLP